MLLVAIILGSVGSAGLIALIMLDGKIESKMKKIYFIISASLIISSLLIFRKAVSEDTRKENIEIIQN